MKASFKNFKTTLFSALLLLTSGCSNNSEVDTSLSGSGVFTSTLSNATIEGTLFLPQGNGPFPVVIIVPGSGSELREESAPFAELFNPQGHAVYTYDKRGIGGSTGTYPVETSTTQNEFLEARAEDVLGIIETLKKHRDIDPNKIGLMSASQGTWVAALVYQETQNLSQLIMASGGAVPTSYEFFYDTLLLNNPTLTVKEGHDRLAQFQGDPGFDPQDIFRSMDIPVLFVLGALDRSHPTLWEKDFIAALDKPNFTIHCYPDLGHELTDMDTGLVPQELLTNIIDWLEQL